MKGARFSPPFSCPRAFLLNTYMALDLDKLNDSPHVLDILIQMEDVLDSLDLYVFKNWYNGEIVNGPASRRYWFDFTLRFALGEMPDPRGAMRLVKHGILVKYSKVIVSQKADTKSDEETDETPSPTHWHVEISVPRRLVSDMNAGELDFYDDEVEVEDVQDAQDAGITDETGYYDQDDAGGPDMASAGGSGPDDGTQAMGDNDGEEDDDA